MSSSTFGLSRRSLLFAPAAALAAQDRAAAKVTPTKLEVFRVKVNQRGDWILVRMHTSAGVSGVGDASHGRDDQVLPLLARFFEQIRGRGIFEVEWLRKAAEPDVAAKGRPAAVALSGLEQCLWDIRGKLFGVPVYELLGGRLHSRIRDYANINRAANEDRSPAAFARLGEQAVKAGFDAVKLAPFDDMPRLDAATARLEEFTKLGLARATAVRQAIGPKADLLIDAHSHFNLERGLELARRIEPLNLFWLEEVTPARPVENLARINQAARMPTAGGESIYGVKGFFPYIAGGAVDIAMPDIKYCGGVLELKKIAAMAEAAAMPVSPHGPASPVGNAAAAQVCAGVPNFLILEYAFGEVPWRAELVDPPEALTRGYIELSDRPGFGLQLNEAAIEKRGIRC